MQTAITGSGTRRVETLYMITMAWCVFCCGLVLMTHAGHAAMRPMPLEEIAGLADTVVLGVVTRQESAWNAPHTTIHTDVTVAVERALVGAPGDAVTFRIAGGIVGKMGMRTSNDPVLRDGERLIVFLDTTAAPGSVVGMQQGTFTVRDNTVTYAGETWPLADFIAAILAARR